MQEREQERGQAQEQAQGQEDAQRLQFSQQEWGQLQGLRMELKHHNPLLILTRSREVQCLNAAFKRR
jgi:hypothetical protein